MVSLKEFFRFPLVPIFDLAKRKYIAGTQVEDAIQVCQRLENEQFSTAISYLGSYQDASRDRILECYKGLMGIHAYRLNSFLSLNSAVYQSMLRWTGKTFESLLEFAKDRQSFIHFDLVRYTDVHFMWHVVKQVMDRGCRTGATIPANWLRSMEDARRWKGLDLRIRVVQGRGLDPSEPKVIHLSVAKIRGRYLRLIEGLVGRKALVAVATHDLNLAKEALRRLHQSSTPCELELSYGAHNSKLARWAKGLKIPVRVYVPYGTSSLSYYPGGMGNLIQDVLIPESRGRCQSPQGRGSARSVRDHIEMNTRCS